VQESLQGKPQVGAATLDLAVVCCICIKPHIPDLVPHHVTCALSAPEYICKGALLSAACITPEQVQQELPLWQKLGQQLALQLGFDHDTMDKVQRWVVVLAPFPLHLTGDSLDTQFQKQMKQHMCVSTCQPCLREVTACSVQT
jgi:hypothetical protein